MPIYKTKDLPTYNEPLQRRGALAIWFDPEMTWETEPTSKRWQQDARNVTRRFGPSASCSDLARGRPTASGRAFRSVDPYAATCASCVLPQRRPDWCYPLPYGADVGGVSSFRAPCKTVSHLVNQVPLLLW